ncbi:MAG: class I SAM-dependent methyltransferase [Verrucomicrobiota bacterium]|jgi:SAM-dependent methyltransferase
MSSSASFLDPIVLPLIRGDSILDVACGFGRWGCLMRTNYGEWDLSGPPVVDALDAFAPNVEYARKLGVYREVWQAELPCAIPRAKYDTILASEVLEHLPMSVVEKVLDEFEAAARRRVIVTTPNWQCLRGGSETFLGQNEFDHHLSYISAGQFRRRGYRVYGAGFGNPRALSVKFFAHTVRLFGVRDFSMFDSLSKNMPSLAHTIVAVKDHS